MSYCPGVTSANHVMVLAPESRSIPEIAMNDAGDEESDSVTSSIYLPEISLAQSASRISEIRAEDNADGESHSMLSWICL